MPAPEGWLSFDDASGRVVDHLECSIGKAQAIVNDALASKEVGIKPYTLNLRPGTLPRQLPTWLIIFKEDDFTYWLDQHYPQQKLSTKIKRKSKRATSQLLDKAMAEFRRSGLAETMDEFENFGRDKFDVTDQEALRDKYRDTYGNPGPGRRRINPRK
jgi:hypothetical protein